MGNTEMDIIDLLRTLWQKKWLIIVGTMTCMIAAGIASTMLTPVYEIDALIQTGKFLAQTQTGSFEEVMVEDPRQIADKVTHKSYNAVIATKLKLDEKDLPEIMGASIQNTYLTRIWTRSSDVEQSINVLNLLLEILQEDINSKIEVEINNIDAEIKQREITIELQNDQIGILQKKLKIIDQRKRDILKEMDVVKKKMDALEDGQLKALSKTNASEAESLGLLLYSNEIQQSIQYYGILNEKLTKERMLEETINSQIKTESSSISQMQNTIANLRMRKGRVDPMKIIKSPSPSVNPLSLRTSYTVIIAGILGFILLSLGVLFIGYVQKSVLLKSS